MFAELGHEALADVPVSCHPPVPGAELQGVNVPMVAVPVKQPEGMLLTESTGQYIPVDQGGRKGAHGNALTKQVCLLNISVYIQSMFSVKVSLN